MAKTRPNPCMRGATAPVAVLDQLTEWQSFKPGLARMHRVLELLGKPHLQYRHILVGGTNGKGTVATNIAAHVEGKTGLFTSPHLQNVRERITINGSWLGDGVWQGAYERIQKKAPAANLSYFEWLTVLACVIFAAEKVDLAVFEVGLGGRLDAVNALQPELSVLTGVALDHTEILGLSIEKIALEKIEIARMGKPFLLPQTLLSIDSVVRRLQEIGSLQLPFEGGQGFADTQTIVSAALSAMKVSPHLDRWLLPAGRREQVDAYPGLILDGAHNSAAWKDLCRWIKKMGIDRINILCSLSKGRDPSQFLKDMKPIIKTAYFWTAGFEKELDASYWPGEVVRIDNSSLKSLLESPLLVTGSLYLIGAFKKWLDE